MIRKFMHYNYADYYCEHVSMLTELLQFVCCDCDVQDKLEKQHTSNHRTISELETNLAKAEAYSEAMQKYVREIEQANDDLERAKR